jgi:anti-anti-sigma factor
VRRDGVEAAIEDSAAPIHDRRGQVTGAVMVFHDVSKARAMSLKMAHLAQHDVLTDLPNRLLFSDRLADLGVADLPSEIMVYEVAGPIFFGAVENFKRPLLEARPYPKALIIRLDRVPFMDITGIQTLQEVMEQLRKREVTVLLCEANARVLGKLRTAGVLSETASNEDYCESLRDALLSAGIGRTAGASS